jgi:hypothetical protein
MAEEYTLTTPETTPAVTNAAYKVEMLHFDWVAGTIGVRLKGQNGELIHTGYGGPMATQAEKDEAIQMMRSLNTANLTTKSLHKRVLERLSTDGKIPPGTTTGTPDPVT